MNLVKQISLMPVAQPASLKILKIKGPAKRIIIAATTSIPFLKQINMITQSQ